MNTKNLLSIKEYDHMVWLMMPPLCGRHCKTDELESDWSEDALSIDERLYDRGLVKWVRCPLNIGVHSLPNYKGKQAMDRYLKSRSAA